MSDEGQWCDPGYCQLAEVSNYAKELKDKLAKAVEALDKMNVGEGWAAQIARATLAEIKGESHE